MSYRFLSMIFVVMAFAISGCAEQHRRVVECAGMPVKGWDGLLQSVPFTQLTNRKETPLDPIAETSQMSLADSNYEYTILLTYTFSYPEGARNRFDSANGCVNAASLLVHYPIEDSRTAALSEFMNFLMGKNVPKKLMDAIKAAQIKSADYASIGRLQDAEISAGIVEHNARGRFFLVEIKSIKQGAGFPQIGNIK